MTKRIFRSIFFTALGVLLASAVLILGILYQYFSQELENEVHNQAVYLSAGVDALGVSYLEEIEEPEDGTRITLIAADGTVLYDNEADAASMENHAKREEVVEAKNNGIGESSRYSATLSEQTYYYALLLENGDVLRLSSTQDSSFALVLGMIYPFVAILMLTLAVSGFLAWAIAPPDCAAAQRDESGSSGGNRYLRRTDAAFDADVAAKSSDRRTASGNCTAASRNLSPLRKI